MPNGFVGSKKEWERIEFPLRALDCPLEDFARQHQMRAAHLEFRDLMNRVTGLGGPS